MGIASKNGKRILRELEQSGVAITGIYGSKRASSLLMCLSKALIIFLVCSGTVLGFSDAFSLNYNKITVILFIALISFAVSLVYVNKFLFYSGYVILLAIFTVELVRYYLYANSGFQAIMNTVREAYGEYFNMSVVRSSEEIYSNRHITITIALIFVSFFLIIMYNITVSRYMNFAETFAISFILLEMPLYIGLKPPLFSVILVMTGCTATGLLQRGSFNRIRVSGRRAPDFIRDKIFKRTFYTSRGSHKGILFTIVFAYVFSLVICVISQSVYDRGLGENGEDSAKAAFDDTVKILVQNGFSGLFNRYDSFNGLARGALGGVSSVRPDFQTDLVVDYIPDGEDTLYLPGFYGTEYTGQRWNEYQGPGRDLDEEFAKMVIEGDMTAAGMRIRYLDMSFGMLITPYYTLAENVKDKQEEESFTGNDGNKLISHYVSNIKYLPINNAEYKKIDKEILNKIYSIKGYDDYLGHNRFISYSLNGYLAEYVMEHDNLGLDYDIYSKAINENDIEGVNEFRLSACEAIKKLFLDEYPYSLTPGKTPEDENFVRYFLGTQKKGYCSHFASAAVMLLRHLGIPARYVEGYCIPPSLLMENGRQIDEKGTFSVEVSDFYAHAWPEVYIEGKGFVPYEVTPPSFEDVTPAAVGGIGDFLRRLLTVDLGIGDTSEESLSVTGDTSQAATEENDGPDLNIIVIPVGIVAAFACLFWIIFILIKKIIKELRYRRWLEQGEYIPLVYGRYIDLVKKLKKKKIIQAENPLPMELSTALAKHCHESKQDEKPQEIEALLQQCEEIFGYAERVLYSPAYNSSVEEYEKYYTFLKVTINKLL